MFFWFWKADALRTTSFFFYIEPKHLVIVYNSMFCKLILILYRYLPLMAMMASNMLYQQNDQCDTKLCYDLLIHVFDQHFTR